MYINLRSKIPSTKPIYTIFKYESLFSGYVTHLHTAETKVILLHVFEIPTLQSGRYDGE